MATDSSKIIAVGIALGTVAWQLDEPTGGLSWVGLTVLLTAAWLYDVAAASRTAAAADLRAAADNAPGMIGAPTRAYSRRSENDGEVRTGWAVPLRTGGIYFFTLSGARQYPPSEIAKIDRSLPYGRVQVTTVSGFRPIIVIEVQDWNTEAWSHLDAKAATPNLD
ncbi:hypothetical protein [Streptomyces sp. NPDC090021]|uniref:hypothetical protein n=1 Tax=Streptomyces sp. NPDC090021 TaxID=3365919 RepID=UPI00380E662A